MAKINATTIIYQQAWVQAYQRGEVELTFKDAAEAVRARFSLYNAVKESRSDLPADVREAYLNVSLQVSPEGRENVIRLRRADRDPLVAGIASQLGLSLDPALARTGVAAALRVDPMPEDIQASGDRLLRLLAEEQEAPIERSETQLAQAENPIQSDADQAPTSIQSPNPFYRR